MRIINDLGAIRDIDISSQKNVGIIIDGKTQRLFFGQQLDKNNIREHFREHRKLPRAIGVWGAKKCGIFIFYKGMCTYYRITADVFEVPMGRYRTPEEVMDYYPGRELCKDQNIIKEVLEKEKHRGIWEKCNH